MIKFNGVEINVTKFPDKTSQVWKLTNLVSLDNNTVDWYFDYEGEIVLLAQLKFLLDSVDIMPTLYIHYLPYGRQDKDVSNDSTFALFPFAKFLNVLEFKVINILDPHSRKATRLIDNSKAIYKYEYLQSVIKDRNIDVLCFPDKGAFEKYSTLPVYRSLPFIVGEKVREQSTGNITRYDISGNVKDRNILIVDDICDGGATFIILARSLKALGAKEVNLFVTHGLFTKGKDILLNAGISKIF
jgi:ribose-phosphate pyrophosphokinase